MSEYWVSKKKYFCRYCDVYIADDAPSRSHHENGMRHKGNKERFVKGLYKAGEKKKKDEEEEKREMKNVEAAAQRAYALDVGAGRAGPSGLSLPEPKPKAAAAPPKKPSNPYANYTTAASLGYTDPDTERYEAELERRRTQGIAGDWELLPVTSNSTPPPPAPEDGEMKPSLVGSDMATGEKRPAEAVTTGSDDDSRAWKLRKKTTRLGDDYDPGAIPIKIKPRIKQEDLVKSEASDNISITNAAAATSNGIVPATESASTSTEVPKWTKIQWKKAATEPVGVLSSSLADSPPTTPTTSTPTPNPISNPIINNIPVVESVAEPIPKVEAPPVELKESTPPSGAGGLFKKRKAPAGGSGRGRRDRF